VNHFCHDPVKLQLEISSMCNAMCLGCVRTDQSNYNHVKECIPTKKMVSFDTFKKILISPAFGAIDFLDFCGTIDDPLMHPDFFKMLEFAGKYNSKLSVNIHTNGSLRNTSDWRKLAHILNEFTRDHRVLFSIDGLADTNHIYRQNTDYIKIIKNAAAFIQEGGIAIWQYIVFPWNKHQVEEARELSKSLGFARFDIREDRTSVSEIGLEGINKRKKRNKKSNGNESTMEELLESYTDKNILEIKCNNKDKNMYFISHDSRLWPCCFIPNGFFQNNKTKVDFLQQRIYDQYGKDFNDITVHTVDDILEHDFFMKDLVNSWDKNVGLGPCGKITRCADTCTVKRLQENPISTRSKEWLKNE